MAKNELVAAEERPSYLAELEKAGGAKLQDNFGAEDVVLPRIKLLQGMSTEVGNFPGAVPGVFWHTGFDQALGNSFKFVICSRNKKYLLVAPINDGQGILARADDARNWDREGSWEVAIDPKAKRKVTWTIEDKSVEHSDVARWGSSDPADPDSPPAATLFYDYLVILPDHMDLGPCVLSLARSQIKRGKKGLNDKISLHASAGRPMQAIVFSANVQNESGPAGPYFGHQFVQSGFAPEAVYKQAVKLSEVMKSYKVADEEGDLHDKSDADSDDF
jgi:hypothetical protein